MKIAIFSDTFPPQINGVANVAYSSAVGLSKLGHKVMVFTASSVAKDRIKDKDLFKNDHFELVRVPSVSTRFYPGARWALPTGVTTNKLRKFRPDIIHTHTPFSIGWGLIGPAKLMHIPIVGTHHTFYDHYLKHAKLDYRWGKKFSWAYTLGYYNLCNLILSPSNSLAKELKQHGLKKPFQILANTIDTELFRPAKDSAIKEKLKKKFGFKPKTLVYMGRVSYEKSIDQVIKATSEIAKKFPDIELILIGDGPEREKLEKLAKDLKIDKKVTFCGFRQGQKLVESLQACDIFLTASKTENMPLSVMEALACGLPVVGVDALGIPEIVKEGKNGFLVEPDNYREMARKTLELLKDEKLLEQFSLASRELSTKYSQGNIAISLEKIYTKLIQKRKR